METFTNEIRKFAKKHEVKLLHHGKVEAIQAIQMLDTNEQVRRLKKKKKPSELVWWSLQAEHSEVHHKHY